MAQKILIKKSTIEGKVPTPAQLDIGELAVNTADSALYSKHSDEKISRLNTPQPTVGLREGRYYPAFGRITQLGSENTTIPASYLIPTPIFLVEAATITQLFCRLAIGASGATMRFALYRHNSAGGLGDKIYQSSAIAATTAGTLATGAISVPLAAGTYALCVIFSAAVTVPFNANLASPYLFGLGATGAGESTPIYLLAGFPATLPADMTSTEPATYAQPSFPEVLYTITK